MRPNYSLEGRLASAAKVGAEDTIVGALEAAGADHVSPVRTEGVQYVHVANGSKWARIRVFNPEHDNYLVGEPSDIHALVEIDGSCEWESVVRHACAVLGLVPDEQDIAERRSNWTTSERHHQFVPTRRRTTCLRGQALVDAVTKGMGAGPCDEPTIGRALDRLVRLPATHRNKIVRTVLFAGGDEGVLGQFAFAHPKHRAELKNVVRRRQITGLEAWIVMLGIDT